MSSLATVSTLVFLSSLPVARADIHCDISIGSANICSWFDFHGGVIVAVVGGLVTLVVFLGFSIYACLLRPRVPPRLMSYAPSDQLTAPSPVPVHRPQQPYTFSVPGESWKSPYSAAANKEWTSIDLSRDVYAHRGPRGYAV